MWSSDLFKRLEPATVVPDYVYDPTQLPLDQSSLVDIYFQGRDILNERFDGFYGSAPTEFDSPRTFLVDYYQSNLIVGWWEVLQRIGLG